MDIETKNDISWLKDFQAFPDEDILEGLPEGINVFGVGEGHTNLFQRILFQNALKRLAPLGYKLAIESSQQNQEAVNRSLEELPDDPRLIAKSLLPVSNTLNYFDTILCGYSSYKILSYAKDLGMQIHCVDDKDLKKYDPCSPEGIKRRNQKLAGNIAELGDCVFLGGTKHFFSMETETGNKIPSVQELLQRYSLKTYTFAMASDCNSSRAIPSAFDEMKKRPKQKIYESYKQNYESVLENKPVLIDMKEITRGAGKSVPDKYMLFSRESSEWLHMYHLIQHYWYRPEVEACMLGAIEDKFGASFFNAAQQNYPILIP